MVRSGEVMGPWFGRRVGSSWLRTTKLPASRASARAFPLAAAWSLSVLEYNELWWALKSPTMRVSSSWVVKRRSRLGR